jgi:hypothetical protein
MHMSLAFAKESSFLSIPSSGFTPKDVTENLGYDGNSSGTARFFDNNSWMFAPVALPQGATVTGMRCGGMAPSPEFRINFTLRRNQPQVANEDMATVMTTFEGVGFQHPETTSITSPVVDNANFNYYIVAEARHIDVGLCQKCTVGYCRIRYTID